MGTLTASAVPAVPAVVVQGVVTPRKARLEGLVMVGNSRVRKMAAAVAWVTLELLVPKAVMAALGYRQASQGRQWFALLVAVLAVGMSLVALVVKAEMARVTTPQPRRGLLTQAPVAAAVDIPVLVLAETVAQAAQES